EYGSSDGCGHGVRGGRRLSDSDYALRVCHAEPTMVVAPRLLPWCGQCLVGEAGGCSRGVRRALVERCGSAAGRTADSQEPRRQHGALAAKLRATLRECVPGWVQRQHFVLRGNRSAGPGPGKTREEPGYEPATDSAV